MSNHITVARTKKERRFLQWINRYSGWWYLICTPGDEHMTPQMMRMLIMRLKKESFYEIIFVLLMVHRDAPCMKNFWGTMLLEGTIAHWEQERDQILTAFIQYFE